MKTPNKNRHLLKGILVAAMLQMLVCSAVGYGQEPGRERFVPADQLDSVFARNPKGVMLPRAKFDDLLKKAQAAKAKLDKLPVRTTIRSATYTVQQQDNHAVVNVALEIEQFVDDWVTLQIPVGHLLPESASIGEDAAAIGVELGKPGLLTLVHREPGRFALNLTLSTPLGVVGSDRLAAIKLIPDVTSSLTVTCPKDRYLKVNDLELQRPAALDLPTEYTIPVGNQPEIRLKWTLRRQETDMQTLIFGRTDAQIKLTSDSLRWDSNTRISVFGNAINQLIARVPASLEVTAVDSTGLESWKLEDDPENAGQTRVLLNYRQPFSEDRIVKLSAVAPLATDGTTAVPALEFLELTAHTGRLNVSHDQQLRLRADVGDGVRHLGTGDGRQSQPAAELFDFWLQNYKLSVSVRPRDRELFAEVNSTLTIVDTTATFACDLTVETLNDGLFELAVNVPDGWQIGQVTGAQNAPLKWRTGSQDGQIVVTPANPVAAGGLFSLRLPFTRTINDPATAQVVNLPLLTAVDALTVGGTYEISASSDLIVTPLEVFGLSPIGDEDGILLYETQGATWSGQISVLRQPVRLASRAVIRSWMDTRQKTTDLVVTVDVLSGTTRTLELSLPDYLGEDVRFTVVSIGQVPGMTQDHVPASITITEQSATEPVDGRRAFQLTFDQRFAGALTVKSLIRQDQTDETKLNAVSVNVVGAVRQHGLVVFEAYPEQQLKPATDDLKTGGLSIADAGLVAPPSTETNRRTALVFRYIQPQYSLEIEENRFETEAVPSAVCELIDNVSVLSETGSVQRSCRAKLRCVGVQTLQFRLPATENPFLWSTILNGNAVEVRREGESFLVAIPTSADQTEHTLEILFQSQLAETSMLGETHQQSLQFLIDSVGGTAAPIEILEQSWQVRFPDSSVLLGLDGGFESLRDLDRPGWLQSAASGLKLPKTSRLLQQLIPFGVFVLVLFVVTVLIVRKRWKSLAATSVIGLFAVVFLLSGGSEFAPTATVVDMSAADMGYESSYSSGMAEGTENSYGNLDQDFMVSDLEALPERSQPNAVDMPESAESELSSARAKSEAPRSTRTPQPETAIAGEPQEVDLKSNSVADGSTRAAPRGGDFGRQAGAGFGAGGGFGGMMGTPTNNRGEAGMMDESVIDPRASMPQTPPTDAGPPAIDSAQFSSPQLLVPSSPAPTAMTGAARLSVRAEIADPDDYRSFGFRSIGFGSDAGQLRITIQKHSTIIALRLIVAATVFLACVRMNRVPPLQKFSLAVILISVALAAVPLLSGSWQCLPDGIVLGTVLGVAVWSCRWMACGCRKLWIQCCSNKRLVFLKSKDAAVAALLLICVVCGRPSVFAAPPEREDDNLRPDVILPYSPDRPSVLADRVYLPHDEFLKLYRAASPDVLQIQSAPVRSSVVAAFYKSGERKQIREKSWSQRFTVRYVIRSFHNKAVTVPLPLGPVAIHSAILDGSPAVLTAVASAVVQPQFGGQQGGRAQVKVNGPPPVQQQQLAQKPGADFATGSAFSVRIPTTGLHLLDVEFDVSAVVDGSVGRIVVPLLPVPAGTMNFDLPADDLDVKINGRSNAYRRTAGSLVIPVANNGTTQIEWQPQTNRNAADTVYHSSVRTALLINDTGLTLHSSISVNCRQGSLSELSVTIPAEYAVQKVEGSEVAGWNVNEGDDRELRLLFREPVEEATAVNLILFRRQVFSTDADEVAVPVPAVKGASRDSGHVTLFAGREVETRVNSLSGVSQINAAESQVPDDIDAASRRVLAWRYTRHPAAIAIRVFRTADRMTARILNGVLLESQRQLWTTLVSATISGSPRRGLEIVLPADMVVLDVSANNLADWYLTPAAENGDTKSLNIQFNAAATGNQNVVIQSQRGSGGDDSQPVVQVPIIENADETETHLSLWLNSASSFEGATADGWKQAKAGLLVDQALLKLRTRAPDISFRNDQPAPSPITLSLGQKAVTLTPASVLVSGVTDTSLELTLGLSWRIQNATREFSFTISEQLRDVFDFQVPGLRQLEFGQAENGRIPLTIHLQQAVTDKLFVIGTGTLPLPQSRQIEPLPPVFTTKPQSGVSLAPQSHFWVVVNQSAALLAPVDASTDGEDVTLDDITLPEGFLKQSVAIRRLRTDRQNSPWKISFPTKQAVSPAVVALAAHTTVVAKDGTWRSRHALQVRNESRQYLPVVIPDESHFLYCLVGDRPARVVTRTVDESTMHLIPVPQSGELAAPFNVEFALSGSLNNRRPDLSAQSIQVPAPRFPEFRENKEFGITVSRNTWDVYLPDKWKASLVDDPRRSNVISADQDDFEDAQVLSVVDNARSMLNNYNFITDRMGYGRQQLLQQESALQQMRGNTLEAEQQRSLALEELQVLKESISNDYEQGMQQPDEAANPFLNQLDFDNNAFNAKNNDALIMSNSSGGSGGIALDKSGSIGSFNFVVPVESEEQKRISKSKSAADGKPSAGEGERGKSDNSPAKKAPENRSKLLQRRGANLKQQSERVKGKAAEKQLGDNQQGQSAQETPKFSTIDVGGEVMSQKQAQNPAFADGGNRFRLEAATGVQANPESLFDELVAQELPPNQAPAQSAEEVAKGLLSLRFQIPQAGVPHKFIQPGGNAILTLEVRGRESINSGLSLLWAVICIVLAVVVLKARSACSVFIRLSLLTAVAALAGWLCFPAAFQSFMLMLCVIASICFSAAIVLYSRRQVA